jgi:hypothetical protein
MNHALVDQIARAVLYEGYILYPYRPSVKNQKRWTFGGLVPRTYSEARRQEDPWQMQAECLLVGDAAPDVTVSVRFLQLVSRLVAEFPEPSPVWPAEGTCPSRIVDVLQVGDDRYYTWQEAVEQVVEIEAAHPGTLANNSLVRPFVLNASRDREPLRNADGLYVGEIIRERKDVQGNVELRAVRLSEDVTRITVTIENRTPDIASELCRDEALEHGLVSTHIVIQAHGAEFASMIDPPDVLRAHASACRNVNCWPVLVGDQGEHDTMLAAPLILYDYPQIAPESPGELFDGTEIDEILTLRIMTMTDDEKAAMAAVDDRARAILTRTLLLDNEDFLKLHGTMRGLRPYPGVRDDE